MRYAKFEVTDKAIGVCAIDYRPIHKQQCLAYGSDLFCRECIQEMFNLALDHGLVSAPNKGEHDQVEPQETRSSFVCPVCNETFGSQQALAGHRRKH